jgi:hypothetical protein
MNKYCIQTLNIPDYLEVESPDEEVGLLQAKAFKDYARQGERIKADRPKLYGLILGKINVESKYEVAQEANYEIWQLVTDPENFRQTIVKTHKENYIGIISTV